MLKFLKADDNDNAARAIAIPRVSLKTAELKIMKIAPMMIPG